MLQKNRFQKFQHRFSLRFTAVTLVFALVFTLLPTNLFPLSASAETEEVYIVKELEEYRDQNSKTFLKSDGSMTQIVSPEALHFEKDGKWQEIDNTLVATEEKNGYTNAAGAMDVTLPAEITDSKTVTVSDSTHQISFSPVGIISSASGKIKNAAKKTGKIKAKDKTAAELTQATATSGSITYENAYENADVRYDMAASSLKESIILNKKPNKHLKYSYSVNTHGLSAELTDQNTLEFYQGADKDRTVIFTMPAPYMFDNNGETSNSITVDLTKEGKDIYTLTYTPDTEWLRDKNRAYPVTVDPTVEYTPAISSVKATYVGSFDNHNNNADYEMKVGKFNDSFFGRVNYDSYLYMPSITNLPAGSVILNAKLKLYVARAASSTGNFQGLNLGIWQVTSPWDATSTQFTTPLLDSKVSDWVTVYGKTAENPGDVGSYISFDITSFYRKSWRNPYAWKNHGVKIASLDGNNNLSYVTLGGISSTNSHQPYIEVDIINQNGYANNSHSKTIDLESAGTAYVNDFTGHLSLIRDDIGYDGNVLPVDFKMIYNDFEHNQINIGFGDLPAYGNGWRSNYSQKIKFVESATGSSYYEYITADGSVTYFEQVIPDSDITAETDRSTIFVDTTNKAYTLHVGTDYTDYTSLYIKGNINERYYFDTFGRLVKIAGNMEATNNVTSTSGGTNAEPGVIRIFYVSNANDNAMAISHMFDGAGRKYNFVYKDNKLWVVQYMGTGNTSLSSVTYEYDDDNNVKQVCQSDGRNVYYTWHKNNTLDKGVMVEAKSYDARRCIFGYDRNPMGNYINKISLYSANGTLGQSISAVRDSNSVTYTDNNTGKTESIYFDYNGNPVNMNVIATNSDGEMVVGRYEKPTIGSPSAQLVSYSSVQKTVNNLVTNSFAANGLTGWTATPSGSAQLSSTYKRFGTQSFMLGTSAQTLSQEVTLPAAGTYTLSAYAKAESGDTASLSVTGGSATVENAVNAAAETKSAQENQRLCYTFDATTAGTVKVNLNHSGPNHVYFDGIQLESGDTCHQVNLMENSSFDNTWSHWTQQQNTNISLKTETQNNQTNRYAQLNAQWNLATELRQRIPVSGQSGDTYTFGAWIKKPNATSPRDYDIKAQFYNGNTKVGEEADILLRPGNDSWIYMVATATAEAAYTGLEITLCYNYGFNDVSFDDVQVYQSGFSNDYEYNENGQLVGITEIKDDPTAESETDDAADANPSENPTDTPAADTEEQPLEPITLDSLGRVIKTTDKSRVENHLEYDSYSNPLVQYVTNGLDKIEKRSAYSENGNIKTAEWNELGEKTTYNVDENFNLTHSVTNAENVTTSFEYDNYKRLKSSSTPVSGLSSGTALTNTYTYDVENRLKSINDYQVNYDTFGRLSAIHLGSKNLINYHYNSFANGGQLNNITYANGQQLTYHYDSKGRMESVSNKNGEIYKNVYNPNGSLVMMRYGKDSKSYIKYIKDVDGNNTVITHDESYPSIHQTATAQYHKYTETINDSNNYTKTYTTNYAFTENGSNAGASFVHNSVTHQSQTTYDSLGRVQSKAFRNKAGDSTTHVLNTAYYYTNVDKGKTSNQPTVLVHQANNYTKGLVYTYTKTGRIKSVGDVTYEYNEAGMLTRVNDPHAGTTVYSYNQNGALYQAKFYNYTLGEPDNCLKTKTYNYNSEWKDQLVDITVDMETETYDKLNGFKVTYDASGNPLRYGNDEQYLQLTWENGGQLKELECIRPNASVPINYDLSFAYNPQGLRTLKSYQVWPTEGSPYAHDIKYTYNSNGLVTSQYCNNRPDCNFYFYYDKGGHLLACEYNDAIYYYVTNLQGDVIAILDSDGKIVVEYTYDAWGKVLEITGSMKNDIGSHNPFRYRGYYYDTESKLYYLQSRYYDPETGKFLNADSAAMLLSGEKAYTYCNNDPVNNSDPSGTKPYYFIDSYYYTDPISYRCDLSPWADTILHLGCSPDQSTYHDFIYAIYCLGIASEYSNNYSDLEKQLTEMFLLAPTVQPDIELEPHRQTKHMIVRYIHNMTTPIHAPADNNGQSTKSYSDNSFTDFIYGQQQLSEWRYGFDAADECCCGVVALYNMFVLKGKKVFLSDLFLICELRGYGDENGTYTDHAINYFKYIYGYTYKKLTYNQFKKELKKAGNVFIISIDNHDSTYHAICVAVDKNKKINIYNYDNSTTTVTIYTLDIFLKKVTSNDFESGHRIDWEGE